MVGDRADAMLEAMHEGKYRRIEVITGRRQRRNWTDEEKARILAESAEPDVNISAIARRWGVNRGLLNVWRREAGLTSRRSAQAGAQQAMFVPVAVVGDRTSCENSLSDVAHDVAGRIVAPIRKLGEAKRNATRQDAAKVAEALVNIRAYFMPKRAKQKF